MLTEGSVSVQLLTVLVTLNKLLGQSDTVSDLKIHFVHTLYTPSKVEPLFFDL